MNLFRVIVSADAEDPRVSFAGSQIECIVGAESPAGAIVLVTEKVVAGLAPLSFEPRRISVLSIRHDVAVINAPSLGKPATLGPLRGLAERWRLLSNEANRQRAAAIERGDAVDANAQCARERALDVCADELLTFVESVENDK